jgi:hypothetical protein
VDALDALFDRGIGQADDHGFLQPAAGDIHLDLTDDALDALQGHTVQSRQHILISEP